MPVGRGHRFRGPHVALDDPGLAADLGDDPAAPEREHRRRPGDRDRAQEPGRLGDVAAPPPDEGEPDAERDEQRADPDHRVEGEVQQGVRGRPVVGRDRVQPGDLGVGAEADQEGVEVGDRDRPLDPARRCRCRRGTRSGGCRSSGCTPCRRTWPAGCRRLRGPRCRRPGTGAATRSGRSSAGSAGRAGGGGRGALSASRSHRSRRPGSRPRCRRRGSCAGPRSRSPG